MRRLGPLLAALLLATGCRVSRPRPAAPTRLTARLATALELPASPKPRRILHLETWGDGSSPFWAVARPVESDRELVVRARLSLASNEAAKLVVYALDAATAAEWGAAPRPLAAAPAGPRLGECALQSVSRDEVVCQLEFVVSQPAAAMLLVAEHAERGVRAVDVFDAQLFDFRAADGPRVAPLVKRTSLLSDVGVNWQTALSARPGSRYVFPLELEHDAQLVFSLGHEHGSAAAPVRFVVSQDKRVLLDETVAPDGRWRPYRLRLGATAGSSSRLTLESFAATPGQGEARGLWGAPRIISPTGRPNVLMITVDALRPDHLSAYGYPRDTSPFLERFSTIATRFEAGTAQAGRTWESMSSVLTGRYPAHNGVRERGVSLPRDVPTLADLLASQGYDTYAGGDLALFPPATFAAFDEELLAPKPQGRQYTTVPQFASWATQMRNGGVFAWVHLEHPHYELIPTEPGRYAARYSGRFLERYTMADQAKFGFAQSVSPAEQQQIVALYDASIRDADREIAQLLETLDRAEAGENTIIIVTADHGENLGEHQFTLEHETPWDSVLHVPLFISWPGHLNGGQRVGTRVQLIDVAPTVLSLAGLPALPEFDGRDLSAALKGGVLPEKPSVAEFHAQLFSLYFEQYHLVLNPLEGTLILKGRPLTFEKKALYDLDQDPQELHNLMAQPSPGAAALVRRAELEIERLNRLAQTRGGAAPGQAALEALRQAGYLQQEDAPKAGAP